MIIVPEFLFFGFLLWAIIASMALVMFALAIKRYAPEAFIFWRARREGKPLALVHYPEGIVRAYVPREEKRLNPSVTNYYYVGDVGIKFKGTNATLERWNGRIPIYHYFVNIPEAIATREAVAFSQFKDYLKEHKIDVSGIEDIAFFVISRYEKYLGKLMEQKEEIKERLMKQLKKERKVIDETEVEEIVRANIEEQAMRQALQDTGLDNEEMVQKMVHLLKFIEKNREEIEKMKTKSGQFTYQVVANAIDIVSAYTSANIAHTKAVLESAIRESLGSEVKDYIKYGMLIFIGCLGLGVLFILTHSFMS